MSSIIGIFFMNKDHVYNTRILSSSANAANKTLCSHLLSDLPYRHIFTYISIKLRKLSFSFLCSHLVRRASANVVSIIAKYAIPAGEWPELLPFLFQCSQSPQEDHREVSLSL
jgi:hypothetical protein